MRVVESECDSVTKRWVMCFLVCVDLFLCVDRIVVPWFRGSRLCESWLSSNVNRRSNPYLPVSAKWRSTLVRSGKLADQQKIKDQREEKDHVVIVILHTVQSTSEHRESPIIGRPTVYSGSCTDGLVCRVCFYFGRDNQAKWIVFLGSFAHNRVESMIANLFFLVSSFLFLVLPLPVFVA